MKSTWKSFSSFSIYCVPTVSVSVSDKYVVVLLILVTFLLLLKMHRLQWCCREHNFAALAANMQKTVRIHGRKRLKCNNKLPYMASLLRHLLPGLVYDYSLDSRLLSEQSVVNSGKGLWQMWVLNVDWVMNVVMFWMMQSCCLNRSDNFSKVPF